MSIGSAIVSGIGAVGGLLSARSDRRASRAASAEEQRRFEASRFRPFTIGFGPQPQQQPAGGFFPSGFSGLAGLAGDFPGLDLSRFQGLFGNAPAPAPQQAPGSSVSFDQLGNAQLTLGQGEQEAFDLLQGLGLGGLNTVAGDQFNPLQAFEGLGSSALEADLLSRLSPQLGAGDLFSSGLLQGGALRGALGNLGGSFGTNLADLSASPFFGAAFDQLATAGQSADRLSADRLSLLREQARPFEERATANFADTLFGRGQLGTTGGGILAEGFARGLGQADLQRQLAAQDLGLRVQDQAGGLASRFAGTGLSGLQTGDLLRTGAAGRFQGLGSLQDRLTGSLLDRRINVDEIRNRRANDRFARQAGLFESRLGLQDTLLQRALGQLAGTQGIQNQLISLADLGLRGQAARAGANINSPALLGLAGQLRQSGNNGIQGSLASLAAGLGSIRRPSSSFNSDDLFINPGLIPPRR